MRKTLAAAAALTALATPASVLVAVAPANAYAGTPGCVTLTEYKSIHNGMTQTQVARRFGTYAHPYWGTATFRYDSTYDHEVDREYRNCDKYGKPKSFLYHGSVEVDFEKEINWDTMRMPAGPLHSNYKSRASY